MNQDNSLDAAQQEPEIPEGFEHHSEVHIYVKSDGPGAVETLPVIASSCPCVRCTAITLGTLERLTKELRETLAGRVTVITTGEGGKIH